MGFSSWMSSVMSNTLVCTIEKFQVEYLGTLITRHRQTLEYQYVERRHGVIETFKYFPSIVMGVSNSVTKYICS